MNRARGFTLVELITVIVVLSIVAAIGSGFVVTAIDSYRDTEQRAKLVQKGRLVIEQLTRQLRLALPHSVRVSTAGDCIEFIPIIGGATYTQPIPFDFSGSELAAVNNLDTSPIVEVGLDIDPLYVAVGGLSQAEIYTNATPSALADYQGITPGSPTVVQFLSHVFPRNSLNRRTFITGSPERICLAGGQLVQYSNYGLDTASPIDEVNPGGDDSLVAAGVGPSSGGAFVLSPGSEDRGTAIHINLIFNQGNSAVELNHTVLVRNVP